MIINKDKNKSKRNTKILYTVALLAGVNSAIESRVEKFISDNKYDIILSYGAMIPR